VTINLFTMVPHNHTASSYYRLEVPIRTAHDIGLDIRAVVDTNEANVTSQDRVRAFCEADLVILYQPIGEGTLQNIRGVQSFIPSKRDGDWKWPPSVVVETDDNIFNVSPLNHAYQNLGTRDMSGKELPDGHQIGVVQNGERRVLWKDGDRGFSLARNRQTLAGYRKILEMADAISCSTPAVAESVRREVNPNRLQVWPNLVRFSDYEQVDLAEDPRQLKILWQGGVAHYEDWFPLREALGHITNKYPQVHWVIWGAQYPWVNELIPAHRYTFIEWCPYYEYRLRLAMIGHDISLAPLSSNVFNDCRSGIKFYEASVLKKPVATLAQNTGAYSREIIDGETALLFNDPEEFESQLSLLIENADYRRRLGLNAKDWIHENRDAMKEVPKMVSWWERLREERKLEQPHVTDEHWEEIEAEDRVEQERENAVR
jgi:hypothetical protein